MLKGRKSGTVIHKETMRFNDGPDIKIFSTLVPSSRT